MSGTEWWSAWPQAHAELQTRLPGATVAHLDAVVDFVQRWEPRPGHHRRALHVLQVLTAAGMTDPDVLTVGVVLDLVRFGACPIQEIRGQLGSAVTMTLVRLVPVPTAQTDAETARVAALRQLSGSSPAVQAVACADAYVSAAWLGERPDQARADALAEEIGTYLLPVAAEPFGRLLVRALAGLAPPRGAGRQYDAGRDPSLETFAARLRRLREHAQMLPEHVAAAAGLPTEFYLGLEAGQVDPGQLDVRHVQALAVALGVEARHLLPGLQSNLRAEGRR